MVTDLDGTLWGNDLYVPKVHHQAINHLADRNIPLLAATARRPRHTIGPLTANNLEHLPYVCVDGSIGVADGTRFHQSTFAQSDALWCLQELEALHLSPVTYVLNGDVDVVLGPNPTTSPRHLGFLEANAAHDDLATVVSGSAIFGFSMFGLEESVATNAFQALNNSGRVHAVIAPELSYGGWGLVINPVGVTKWTGVLAYCKLRGIDPTRVLTIGDGANDVGMHTASYVAVGVRGGHASAVACSDHLIDPPQNAGWGNVVDLVDRYTAGPNR